MTKTEFFETVKEKVQERVGEGCTVRVSEVVKTNNVRLTGLGILKGTSGVGLTIYLDGYFEEYEKGSKTLDQIVDDILATTENHKTPHVDHELFDDFAKAQDGIVATLVNKERNAEMFVNVPHKDFLDLAVVYRLVMDIDGRKGSLVVNNMLMERWGISEDDLVRVAKQNEATISKAVVRNLSLVLGEAKVSLDEAGVEAEDLPEITPEKDMTVLTTAEQHYGAGVILQDGILEQVAAERDSDLFLIPSSVAEWLAVKCDPESDEYDYQREYLNWLVVSTNLSQLPPDEVLSNHVYLYRRSTKKLEIA